MNSYIENYKKCKFCKILNILNEATIYFSSENIYLNTLCFYERVFKN